MHIVQSPGERRTGTHRFIDEMSEERQEMWVLYCKVAGLEPFEEVSSSPELMEAFCQVLVDYISSGHFGLYERIVEGKERRRAVCEVAAEVYERIAQTTDVALKLNDTYDPGSQLERSEQFAHDLSALGEALALRIELEDRVIGKMLAA